MAHVVAFCSQKGGTGKSGLAQAYAVTAAKEVGHVIVADLDEGQHTSAIWGRVRAENGYLPAVDVRPTARLRAFDYKSLCDVLVIDAPGWADELTVWVAHSAHFTVLPVKPTAEDLPPTINLMKSLRARGVKDYRFGVAINEVMKEREVDYATAELGSAGFTPLPGFLRTALAYRDVRRTGKTMVETGFAGLNGEAARMMEGITRALGEAERQIALDAAARAVDRRERTKGRERA